MTGMEFYKRLQPKYLKWLDSMDRADCINMAAEIAFIKEVMFLLDEGVWETDIPDDMDPAWFLDECVECQQVADNWFDVFNGIDYFNDLMSDEIRRWPQYKQEHRGNDEDH